MPGLTRFMRWPARQGVVLMFHTGYEHACYVVSHKFTDPRRLQHPLEHELTVVAAH